MLSEEAETATEWAKKVLEVMDSRRYVGELEEWVRWRCRLLLCGLAFAGYGRARTVCGYRALEASEQLYGRGRTREELEAAGVPAEYSLPDWTRVTWIVPAFNMHGRRRALDVDLSMYAQVNDEVIVTIARSLGMTWGGVWSVRDTYHFEV